MRVSIVVPFRGGCPHRERAWEWIRERYASAHPDWDLVEASAPDGPWCKGAAVAPVIEASDAEVVVVADADAWCEGLERAVYAVVCGLAAWGMPHRKVHRLDEDATAAVFAGEPWEEQSSFTQRPYEGVWGGGIVVGRRDVFLDVPLDPRYVLWGQEDTSWAVALQCLHGPGWRGDAPLLHLFHPPQDRETRQRGSKESWALFQRYRKARRDPQAMRELLEEAQCPLPA